MKGLLTTFSTIKDPRVMRTKRHLLIDILALVICAVLSGCDDWNDIELYGKTNIDWLRIFLGLANGIPSHDTINRVFSLIDAVEFQEYFIRWVASIATFSEGRVVPIDGKCLCNLCFLLSICKNCPYQSIDCPFQRKAWSDTFAPILITTKY